MQGRVFRSRILAVMPGHWAAVCNEGLSIDKFRASHLLPAPCWVLDLEAHHESARLHSAQTRPCQPWVPGVTQPFRFMSPQGLSLESLGESG